MSAFATGPMPDLEELELESAEDFLWVSRRMALITWVGVRLFNELRRQREFEAVLGRKPGQDLVEVELGDLPTPPSLAAPFVEMYDSLPPHVQRALCRWFLLRRGKRGTIAVWLAGKMGVDPSPMPEPCELFLEAKKAASFPLSPSQVETLDVLSESWDAGLLELFETVAVL